MMKSRCVIVVAAALLLLGGCTLLNPAWHFVNRSSYTVCVVVSGASDFTEAFTLKPGESHEVTPPDQLASALWNNGTAFRWEWTPDTVRGELDSDSNRVIFRNK